MTQYRFLEPMDVLFLRGNKLFGDAGSYGESLVPPWPSVAAGALRSRIMADEGIDFAAFAKGEHTHPVLGTPEQPGSFAVTQFSLARRTDSAVEVLYPLPADLIASEGLNLHRLAPGSLPEGIEGSTPLPKVALLASDERTKPAGGLWLTETAWRKYLGGAMPDAAALVKSSDIWALDHRVGVGLDSHARRASDGKLFTTQAIVFRPEYGFLVGVEGAELPTEGFVRLGGDGRGAALAEANWQPPEADLERITSSGRCRIVLTTPGIFPQGWRLPGSRDDGSFALGEVRGQLVAAAVPRSETVSGWDLARRQPKPAQKAVPAGAVYWLENVQATADQLRALIDRGLWDESIDHARRAEGFNRFVFAND